MTCLEKYNLARLFNKYLIKEMYADDDFINEAISIILRSRKTEKYVNEINIINKNQYGLDFYNYNKRLIQINKNAVKDDILTYNTTILYTIIYECENIDQYEISKSKKSSLKKYLLSEEFTNTFFLEFLDKKINNDMSEIETNELIKQINYCYHKEKQMKKINYCLPSKRMAQIDSFDKTIKIIKSAKTSQKKDMISKLEKSYLLATIMGYKNNNHTITCPTNTFIKYCNTTNEKLLINSLNDLSSLMNLNERLYYGLEISQKEYTHQYEKINKLNKR